MIKQLEIESFGPIESIRWEDLQQINIITGKNSAGKTTLLKALYAAIRSVEQYQRGKEPRSLKEILSDKLYWTFQVNSLGELVCKKTSGALRFSFQSKNNEQLRFEFGETTNRTINKIENTFQPRKENSIFLPAKEILSLQDTIMRVRDEWKMFGFDDTYYDLAKALSPTKKGKNLKSFSEARKQLSEAIGGSIQYDDKQKAWTFESNDKGRYAIDITAEGIKKVSILDAILGNHYLSRDSIIFIDEPESALHPELISKFMDIICALAKDGIQFFIATHSYFVIKKLYINANKQNLKIPLLSFKDEGIELSNLKDGIADNPIVGESVRLYEEELDL
jgi:predicted ATPase